MDALVFNTTRHAFTYTKHAYITLHHTTTVQPSILNTWLTWLPFQSFNHIHLTLWSPWLL